MSKRKAVKIDLTLSSDEENEHGGPRKVPRTPATSFNLSLSQQSASAKRHGSSQNDNDSHWPASTQEIDADMRRTIDLTQDDSSDYESYQLYGVLKTKIVGCRFYNGRATVGEYVVIRREPANQYDRNAIRIDNVMNDQIGHIGRTVAAKLAPLMDNGDLKIEGQLTGEKGEFDCPIALKMFGTSEVVPSWHLKQKMQALNLSVTELNKADREREKRRKELEKQKDAREKAAARMRKNGSVVYDVAEGPGKYSNFNVAGSENGVDESLENLLGGSAASYNPREIQDAVSKFGVGEEVLSGMDLAEQPEEMATTLLPYQRQGLKWMLDHESPKLPARGSDEVVQLWKNANGLYKNIATSFSVSKAPNLASGGILADDMGLGKTIQIISLIVADPKKTQQPTLIISPLSVMSNWRDQAAQHVKKKYAPRVLIYHGQENRGLTAKQFQEYDLVVTTYQTMTMELFPFGQNQPGKIPTKNGLFSLEWRRVVLDEGHNIRNPKAKMSRAACSLMAQSRWILTGTPIVNSLKDLYSHVKFSRLGGGLDQFELFNCTLIRPLKTGNPEARALLQALMSTLCLRRTKDMKFIDLKLPKLTFHKYPVKFLAHEQERYDAFKAEAKGLVEAAKLKKGDKTMTHLLEVLLRLRQTCNHWKMCGDERVKRLLALVEDDTVIDVTKPENKQALQDLLQLKIDSQEDCPVCMEDSMTNPVITACAHAFCRDCIEKVIETQHKCPLCRAELGDETGLVEPAANFGEGEEDGQDVEIDPDSSSSKIEALVKVLQTSAKQKGSKTVVFSQWTTFLNLIEPQLHKQNLVFVRLDGKMNASRRDAAIEALNTDDRVTILLASLSVCSVGLNLVAANNVVLADSWWAPAIEDQAVDRVYRLGQTRDCKVIRLVVENTIEDEVIEIQTRKRKLAAEAFGDKAERRTAQARTGGTLRDIEQMLS